MSYLVRKIKPENWPDGENTFFDKKENLSADAISELQTSNNELSFWRIEELNDETINDVGLALVSKLKYKQNSFKLVAIPLDKFVEKKLAISNTPTHGHTAIESMKANHYDVTNLNYSSLGEVGAIIAKCAENDKYIFTIYVANQITRLKKLYDEGQIKLKNFGEYIQEIIQ